MYTVVEIDGKQYKVQYGGAICAGKLAMKQNATIKFKVVALSSEEGLKVRAPFVEGASVIGEVLKSGRQRKVTVLTYKPKKSLRRKIDHRQPYTRVQIETINA